MSGPKGSFKPGDIVDETICNVKDLLNCGFAELIEEPIVKINEEIVEKPVEEMIIEKAIKIEEVETTEIKPVKSKNSKKKGK